MQLHRLLWGATILVTCMPAARAAPLFIDTTPGEYTFTAPETGDYQIAAYGAPGGAGGAPSTPGAGAEASAVYSLTLNEQLTIYVGGNGGTDSPYGGGGGGGSFVVAATTPLLVGGGGGGGGFQGDGLNASLTTSGIDGVTGSNGSGGSGGTNGSGGGVGANFGGGGGGGISGNGGSISGGGTGGLGLTGSPALQGATNTNGGTGGFGGGGSGSGDYGGGGGGGYSGGGGGSGTSSFDGGGGGGSYVDTTVADGYVGDELLSISGLATGEVVISAAEPVTTPEPASLALLAMGCGMVGFLRSRHRARARFA